MVQILQIIRNRDITKKIRLLGLGLIRTVRFCIKFRMPTIQQLIKNKRQPIENRAKSPALRGCPQRRGVCTRVYVRLV